MEDLFMKGFFFIEVQVQRDCKGLSNNPRMVGVKTLPHLDQWNEGGNSQQDMEGESCVKEIIWRGVVTFGLGVQPGQRNLAGRNPELIFFFSSNLQQITWAKSILKQEGKKPLTRPISEGREHDEGCRVDLGGKWKVSTISCISRASSSTNVLCLGLDSCSQFPAKQKI